MGSCWQIAEQLMAPGKGVLAADESIATMSSRLETAGVEATHPALVEAGQAALAERVAANAAAVRRRAQLQPA